MKIIDLLNKIANGEEVPEKIKDNSNNIWIWDESSQRYHVQDADYITLSFEATHKLNEEIEIIQDSEDIDIQNIEENHSCNPREDVNQENINLLIKAVKQLDNKINKKG